MILYFQYDWDKLIINKYEWLLYFYAVLHKGIFLSLAA